MTREAVRPGPPPLAPEPEWTHYVVLNSAVVIYFKCNCEMLNIIEYTLIMCDAIFHFSDGMSRCGGGCEHSSIQKA